MRGPLSGIVTTSVGAVRSATDRGQRRVVDAAIVPADEQGDGAVGEGGERGLRRQHVGREAVVDELHPADHAERAEPAGQSVEAGRGPRQRLLVRRARDPQTRRARRGRSRRCARCAGPARPSAADHAPSRATSSVVHPADVRAERSGLRAEALVGAVGHGHRHARAWCTATTCRRSSARQCRASRGGRATATSRPPRGARGSGRAPGSSRSRRSSSRGRRPRRGPRAAARCCRRRGRRSRGR